MEETPYVVYILECADKSLYTGITTDIERRFKEHQNGIGSHFTRARKAVRIAFTEVRASRGLALRREAEIKRMTRVKKLELIQSGN